MSNFLIASLDKSQNYKIGSNGHAEIDVSRNTHMDMSEQILQFSFQLVRTKNLFSLHLAFEKILRQFGTAPISESPDFIVLAKMIANTRDIVDGKGEYALSYMMLYTLYGFYPELAKYILETFVESEDGSHPFGSWKDIKYFCEYCCEESGDNFHPFIEHALSLMISQLKKDLCSSEKQTLAAKWCPRESKKHGWVFNRLAVLYYPEYIETAKTEEQKERAINKCKMNFRKLISRMNIQLDTIQIKQCGEDWASIDHTKTTSITLSKQTKALLNLKKDGSTRSYNADRIQCAANFKAFFEKAKTEKAVKGARVAMNDFTVKALSFIYNGQTRSVEADVLNAQWENSSEKQKGDLSKIIPLVDVSGSMCGDPLHSAIALGIRVAEKSMFGKRVLTFSETPMWHNLEDCHTFIDTVKSLSNAKWGATTNFYAAMELILGAIIKDKLTPKDVDGLILAIFSDMQINSSMPAGQQSNAGVQLMYDGVKRRFSEVGMQMYGEPFPVPHLLFWNLAHTMGSPCESTTKNVTMFSGFSPALLNNFCENGVEALKQANPWTTFRDNLTSNTRYNCIGDYIIKYC